MNEALPSKDVRDEPLSPDTERDGNETMEVFSKNHQLHLSLATKHTVYELCLPSKQGVGTDSNRAVPVSGGVQLFWRLRRSILENTKLHRFFGTDVQREHVRADILFPRKFRL